MLAQFRDEVLGFALHTFPRAPVVVAGYYPTISRQTNVRSLAKLITQLPRPAGLVSLIAVERGQMIQQSKLFAERSALQEGANLGEDPHVELYLSLPACLPACSLGLGLAAVP